MPRERINEGVLGGTGVEGRRTGHNDEASEEITAPEEVDYRKKTTKKQKKDIFERPKFE